MGNSQSAAPASSTTTRRDALNCACCGVGVSSSINAACCVPSCTFVEPPPLRNVPGATRDNNAPASSADNTTHGNAILKIQIAIKLIAASAHGTGASIGFPNDLLAMRYSACSTIAATAGLMP